MRTAKKTYNSIWRVFASFPFAGWRRSHRPSLYDISIIDEKEEREDPELNGDIETNTNTNTNASTTPNALRAVFTIGK